MNGPARFSSAGLVLAADDQGDLVRFADIEPALRDSRMLAWLQPLLLGGDDAIAAARGRALAAALHSRQGLPAVELAMQACPA